MPDQAAIRGIDLFCGARGWEARAHASLGVDLLGVESWEPAVRTSEAAGLRVLHADVSALNPLDFTDEVGDDGIVVGSPPCQSRSNAGKRLGAKDVAIVAQCLRDLADGRDTRAEHRAACADERSILTVEPLRWAVALMPRVVLLEQVPPVLPDWRLVGSLLERFGYSWWAGILEAERYGVPQTRERAVLIARRDGQPAHPPAPTHHRFVPNEPRPEASTDLFGTVLPWVSMAEALGWDGGDVMRSNYNDGTTGERGERDAAEPSFVVTSKFDRNFRLPSKIAHEWPQARDCERAVTEPAPTLKGAGNAGQRVWVHDRPATNVNGDPRISAPGHHDPAQSGSQQKDAIRVTVEQAACLQSFPLDWPWQGSRTAQFTQIGNAVPPLLGEAIFRAVMDGVPPTPR